MRAAGRDRALAALAAAYFVVVAVGAAGPDLRSSAEAVGDGRVWLLLTSALAPQGADPGLQLAVAAVLAAAVSFREGPVTWWVAALAGQVLSALLAYAVIGLADLLGSAGAERVAAQPDFGVSCMLGGGAGALLVSGGLALRRHGRRGGDVAATAAAAVTVLVLLALSFGFYDDEHAYSVVIGAAAAWPLVRARHRPVAAG